MNLKKVYIIVGAVLALVGVAALAWYSRQTNTWPQFPETKDSKPAMVVELEPDFSYRTGDPVPVVVYIKQQPGTTVDITSLALEGSFEIRGELDVKDHILEDGCKAFRIKLNLQSFQVTRKLAANISLVWQVDGEKDTREFREKLLEVYTSYTWDGRKQIKEGPLPPATGGHWPLTLLLVFGSAGVFVWGLLYLRRAEINRKEIKVREYRSPRALMKRRVDAAWAKIAGGDLSPEHFTEINAAVRQCFDLETVLLKYVVYALGSGQVQAKQIHGILARCHSAMYSKKTLPTEELAMLRSLLDEVVDHKAPRRSVRSALVVVTTQPAEDSGVQLKPEAGTGAGGANPNAQADGAAAPTPKGEDPKG